MCGGENRDGARFCDSCGAALAAAAPQREQRKTVTVLQCDVTGSTALGERLDPESLRAVLARYFEAAKTVIDRHGGVVEKFIGDAVLAVFGVPVVHEDDALRAVRAAVGIREAIGLLNDELARDYGATLTLRIGVNTGEVVTGTAERLVTGDAVVVAARLEQSAPPGEILIGEETVRLVRGAAEIGPLEEVAAKGKVGPLRAHRVLRVSEGAPERPQRAPFVGRQREQRQLAHAWERVCAERTASLFTVLGAAGVGKSRLAAEFLATLDDGRVVRGRCLSYGEGITYWPVVEILKQMLGASPTTALDEIVVDETAAASLLGLLGEGEQPASPELVAWSVRKLLEAIAESEPVVVVLDDLQWADATLLELVEHVADLSRDAPILLLCLARPDLLDGRPGWGGGKLNSTTVLLEPMPMDDCGRLIDLLLDGAPLGEEVRTRILAASEGFPLFVEEMLALIRERGGDEVEVPPSIQALLATRLDQLDPSERAVLERGAVEGKVFHRGGVEVLTPDEDNLSGRLQALVRKELIRPDRSQLAGDEAYRFRHLLIRDAAYEALPKATRGDLHERLADWLEQRGTALPELDEIVAYHLEQAYRCRTALGPADDRAAALRARARERLEAAADRADARGDPRSVAVLLERSVALLPEGPRSARQRLDLGRALSGIGDTERARQVVEGVLSDARQTGDRGLELLARLLLVTDARLAGQESTAVEADVLAHELINVFERDLDDAALADAWAATAAAALYRCRHADSIASFRRALEHARRAGRKGLERDLQLAIGVSMCYGPTPAAEVVGWCDEHSWLEPMRARVGSLRGLALGQLGRFNEALENLARVDETFRELGLSMRSASVTFGLGDLAFLAADFVRAEELLAAGLAEVERGGGVAVVSTYAARRARALLELGRDDEADDCARTSEQLGAGDDVITQVLWRQARARVLARQGRHDEAARLGREAVEHALATDDLATRGSALADLAVVLESAGDITGARGALERALAEFEQKGVIPEIERTQARLAALPAPA